MSIEAWLAFVAASTILLITGTTRSISTSAGTGSDPGRVDSPPTSTMSAPSAAIATAWIAA